jgi:hypothetical protein
MYYLRLYFKGVDSISVLSFKTAEDRDGFFKSLGGAMHSNDTDPFQWPDGLIVTDEIRMIEKI